MLPTVMCEAILLEKFSIPLGAFYIGAVVIIALLKLAIFATPTGVSGKILDAH
jgi:hypothetical protein